MLTAPEAAQLSQQGKRAAAKERRKEERIRVIARIKKETEATPARIAETEQGIAFAAKEGRRESNCSLRFVRDEDYKGAFSREQLIEPHKEFLAHFERAGYKVELVYQWEPLDNVHSSEWHDIKIKW